MFSVENKNVDICFKTVLSYLDILKYKALAFLKYPKLRVTNNIRTQSYQMFTFFF